MSISANYLDVMQTTGSGGAFITLKGMPYQEFLNVPTTRTEWSGYRCAVNCLGFLFTKFRVKGELWSGRRDGGPFQPRETRPFIDGATAIVIPDIAGQQQIYNLKIDTVINMQHPSKIIFDFLAYGPGYHPAGSNDRSWLEITPML